MLKSRGGLLFPLGDSKGTGTDDELSSNTSASWFNFIDNICAFVTVTIVTTINKDSKVTKKTVDSSFSDQVSHGFS